MIPPRRAAAHLLLAVALALASGAACAQQAPAHAGDAWVDARLVDIGRYAATYRDAFVDELVRYRRAPRELVDELLARPDWSPGDVYFACSLAMQAGRPCRTVADMRQRDPSRDWAAIARELDVAPGSAGYIELKRGIAASYLHWARPLPPDAEARVGHAPAGPGTPPPTKAADAPRHDEPPHRGRH